MNRKTVIAIVLGVGALALGGMASFVTTAM